MSTASTSEVTSTATADPEEFRANLRLADPGVLVAVLAQLTGDASVVDRFAPSITHVPDPPERAGVTDPDTATALADAVIDALGAPHRSDASPVDDLDFFARLLPVALGSVVDAEQVPLLLEQSGFQPSSATLPRTCLLYTSPSPRDRS